MQERHVTGLSRPLRSKGIVLISRETGVAWKQTHPFESTSLFLHDRIVQILPGRPPEETTIANAPQFAPFARLLLALLSRNQREMESYFEITSVEYDADNAGTGETDTSEIGSKNSAPMQDLASAGEIVLTPRTSQLQQMIRTIRVRGDTYVEHITIVHSSGDRTEVALTDHTTDSAELQADERMLHEY